MECYNYTGHVVNFTATKLYNEVATMNAPGCCEGFMPLVCGFWLSKLCAVEMEDVRESFALLSYPSTHH